VVAAAGVIAGSSRRELSDAAKTLREPAVQKIGGYVGALGEQQTPMKIRYAVPHDFPPDLLEELRDVVDRSLPEYPNQCHGGVTIGGLKYYFSYEVRDGVADLSLR
jgi:hypothetical protein